MWISSARPSADIGVYSADTVYRVHVSFRFGVCIAAFDLSIEIFRISSLVSYRRKRDVAPTVRLVLVSFRVGCTTV